jgi:putative glutamine amidotransferase
MNRNLPRIGLTCTTDDGATGPVPQRCVIKTTYVHWVERLGGLPLLLPNVSPDLADAMLEGLDGLLLTGGRDIHPLSYGAEPEKLLGIVDVMRDRFELPLVRAALARRLPLLAICRGLQALNVASGGTLRQDLTHDPRATVQHRMEITGAPSVQHTVEVEPGTRLHRLLGAERVAVNSYHHQAADRLGRDLRVSARAADGTVEGLEGTGSGFVVAVQWHPEAMPADHDVTRRLFEGFLEACRRPVRAVAVAS